MELLCPLCHTKVTLKEKRGDPKRLEGFCGHFPGGPLRRVFDIPNPDYMPDKPAAAKTEPKKIIRKQRSKKS